jgi:hypothetical protein
MARPPRARSRSGIEKKRRKPVIRDTQRLTFAAVFEDFVREKLAGEGKREVLGRDTRPGISAAAG